MALAITSTDGRLEWGGSSSRRSGWRVGLILCAVIGALAGLPATAAHAEDKTAARDHWERGTKFYDLGKYDDAIREFEAAYEAKSDPAFLYNLAQSHRLAGHTNDALRFYRTYLRYVPKAPNRGDIEQRIKDLEKFAADRPSNEQPSINPPPAPVIAGAPISPPPPAAEPSSSPVSAPGPAASAGTGTEPPPVGTTSGSGPSTGTMPAAPSPTVENSGRRTTGIVIAAAGGGLFVVGAIFGLIARTESKKVEKAAQMNERFDPGVESLGQASETLQWVGYGIGLAAIATGVILYVTAAPTVEEAKPPSVAVAPLVSPNAGGALLRVTF